MKTALKAIVLVPLALVAVIFAVANRHIVTISFDPFNADNPAFALSAPLFLTIVLMVMLGVLIGGVATWLTQGSVRSTLRHMRAENDRLRRELQDARLELDLSRRDATRSGVPALSNRDAA
jgi:uncharacterized integral membrane protein